MKRKFEKTIALFDVDGTLTVPRKVGGQRYPGSGLPEILLLLFSMCGLLISLIRSICAFRRFVMSFHDNRCAEACCTSL